MSALKIAPTPWRVGLVDNTIVQAADGTTVAEIVCDYNGPDRWTIMEAHGRLFVAAPDLYRELKDLRDRHYIALISSGTSLERAFLAVAKADAAIAKATGGAA